MFTDLCDANKHFDFYRIWHGLSLTIYALSWRTATISSYSSSKPSSLLLSKSFNISHTSDHHQTDCYILGGTKLQANEWLWHASALTQSICWSCQGECRIKCATFWRIVIKLGRNDCWRSQGTHTYWCNLAIWMDFTLPTCYVFTLFNNCSPIYMGHHTQFSVQLFGWHGLCQSQNISRDYTWLRWCDFVAYQNAFQLFNNLAVF